MAAYCRNPSEPDSDSDLFATRQWLPEDISRPSGMAIPTNGGSPIRKIVLVSNNNEQQIESQTYPQDIRALDPMEHLRKIILFKVTLASHGDDSISNPSIDLSTRLEKLGKSHYNQFHHQGQSGRVDEALACYAHATTLLHEGDPKLPGRLERLGLLYIARFQHSEELRLQDHQKAVSCINRAFSLAPGSQADPLRRINITALLFESRFWRTGDPADGVKAIQYKTEMISMTHETSPELPNHFESLGVLHETLFQCTGNTAYINKAIEYLTQAVKFTPKDPRRLESLGISYRTRSLQVASTTLDDIKKALEYLSLAVEYTPSGHQELPRRFANLGVAWEARFRHLGDLQDNEQAINLKEKAVKCTALNHPDLPIRLESLGVSYETRFQRLGQLEDIEMAINHLTKAVDLTPQNNLGLPRRLENLGTCHAALFEQVKHPEDSKKSIEYLTSAVRSTPESHPDRPRLLNNLGIAYKSRFECGLYADKRDIEKAIEYLTLAVDITITRNDDHPDLPARLDSLGVCYTAKFDPMVDTELIDLQKAIEYGEDAVSRIPDNHVGRARQLANLGISYEMWYEHTMSYEHLSKSLDCFRQATEIVIAPPRERFRSALHWARLLPNSTLSAADCLEAYRIAIDLVPHLVLLGANTRQRYHDLHQVRDLGVEAASMAIRFKNNDLALEWLEQTRCVIWSQTLLLRSGTPLDQLRDMYPDFESTDRLQKIVDQLYHSSLEVDSHMNVRTRSKLKDTPSSLLRSQLVAEYHKIISQVRELPGFRDFLQPERASELIRAARRGPVVIVNCHHSSCDALIVRSESNDITSISLRDYTYQKAQSDYLATRDCVSARGMRGFTILQPESISSNVFEDVLASLWDNIVKPILATLGYMETNASENLPHITWCPTGIMAFLPLHAAGDYRGRSRVFDYVISSYTPTLTSLLSSDPHAFSHNCGLIVIGQPDTKQHSGLHLGPLPGTDKEVEFIRRRTQDKLKYTQLVGPDATVENVLKEMSRNEWVHLACHARQDIKDPIQSGFFLHEGMLDIATIARQLFKKKKGLAFLSACQTATGVDELPDESAHLASCMLVIGYPSVIASMWAVRDDDAPFVADNVYSHLMSCQSIANGEAAVALHNAVAALRERVGVMAFHRWVQYVHMGQ